MKSQDDTAARDMLHVLCQVAQVQSNVPLTTPSNATAAPSPFVPQSAVHQTSLLQAIWVNSRPSHPMNVSQALKTATAASKSSHGGHRRLHAKRLRFLICVKMLLLELEGAQQHSLKLQVKQVVKDCIQRNRNGDPGFNPLDEAAEILVRTTVGDDLWNVATMRLEEKMSERKQRLMMARGSCKTI